MRVPVDLVCAANHAKYTAWDGEMEIIVRRHLGSQGFCSVGMLITRVNGPIEQRTESFYGTARKTIAARILEMDEWIAEQLTSLSTGQGVAKGTESRVYLIR